jgi:hypothetical protein
MEKIRFILLNKLKGRYILNHAPIGWDEADITLKRSETYHGIDIEYTSEFSFVKDGKTYIDEVYDNEGIEGIVEVIIQELYDSAGFKYETVFNGVVNFTNYIREATLTRVNLEQSGLKTRFNNGVDIEVDLINNLALQGENIGQLQAKEVELHSRAIDAEYHGVASEADCVPSSSGPITSAGAHDCPFYFGLSNEITNELSAHMFSTGFNTVDDVVDELLHATGAANRGGAGNYEIYIRLKGLFSIYNYPVGSFLGADSYGDFDKASFGIYFAVNDPTNNRQTLFFDQKTGLNTNTVATGLIPSSYGTFFNVLSSKSVNLALGDKIYVWGEVKVWDISGALLSGGNDYNWEYELSPEFGSCEIKINASTQVDSSNVRGLLNHEVGRRLVQSITGLKDTFYSELMGRIDSTPAYSEDGDASHLFLTSGGQLRGFALDKMPLKTTFTDWFSSNNAFYNIGAGFEIIQGQEALRVEGKGYFYSSEVGLVLDRVTNLKTSVATEYFHNTVKVGYETWQQEEDGGLDEFNTVRNYTLPITKVKKEYTAMSKYIGAGYTIESKRRESYNEEPSRDTNEDNDFFAICVIRNSTGFESETNTGFSKLEGVKSPSTVYNARLTPTRMLKSHMGKIKIGLLYQQANVMRFQTGEGNTEMVSRLYTEPDDVHENQDWSIAKMPEPINEPTYYEFEYALDQFQRRYLRANPYKLITFKNEAGLEFSGHLISVTMSVTGVSNFKLLLSHTQPLDSGSNGRFYIL